MANFEYESLDMAEMAAEYERVSAEYGSKTGGGNNFQNNLVQLPERDGFVLMRILPKKKGEKFVAATRIHTLSNPSKKDEFGKPRKFNFHCPKTLVHTDRGPQWRGECIICKYYSDLWQKSESLSGKAQEDLQNKARDIKPVERYYVNVVVRTEKDKDGNVKKNVGPKIYSFGKTVYAKILRAIGGDAKAGAKPLGDVTHPVNGRDFRVVKKVVKGSGGKEYPNYDMSVFEEVSEAGTTEELEGWLANLHDLQSLRTLKTDEELKHALRVHLGMVKDTSGQDDDLEEFRNAGKVAASEHISTASDTIREELITKTPAPTAAAEPAEAEIMADSEFMDELNNL